MTKEEATREWIKEMSEVPTSAMQKLQEVSDYADCLNITPVCVGDKVVYYTDNNDRAEAEVKEIYINDDDEKIYVLENENDNVTVELQRSEFDREDDYDDMALPMWQTMWTFKNSIDEEWLDKDENKEKMAECGFEIFESEDYGYVFGIDSAGYSFLQEHFIPLYEARGLHWHDEPEHTQETDEIDDRC